MVKSLTIILGALVIFLSFYVKVDIKKHTESPSVIATNYPPCIQMFNSIEKYSDIYNVPRDYAYGIAYAETRYEGPFHWKYKHTQTSSAGAVGPMQVMYGTAKGLFPEKNFTSKE